LFVTEVVILVHSLVTRFISRPIPGEASSHTTISSTPLVLSVSLVLGYLMSVPMFLDEPVSSFSVDSTAYTELDDVVTGFLSTRMEFNSKDVQMVGQHHVDVEQQVAREAPLRALLVHLPSQTIVGFDCVGRDITISINQLDKEEEGMLQGPSTVTGNDNDIVISTPTSAPHAAPPLGCVDNDYVPHIPYSVSTLSTPTSSSGFHLSQFRVPAVRCDVVRVVPATYDIHQLAGEQHVVEAHY
jgi:hypothetical protein